MPIMLRCPLPARRFGKIVGKAFITHYLIPHILQTDFKCFEIGYNENTGQENGFSFIIVSAKSDTAAEIGKTQNESRNPVFRYIHLTTLIPELLDKVDEGVIAFSPAAELKGNGATHFTELHRTLHKNFLIRRFRSSALSLLYYYTKGL